MAELFVVSDTGEKELTPVLTDLEEKGHDVCALSPSPDFFYSLESEDGPDLLLLDLECAPAKEFFDRVLKNTGPFPVIHFKMGTDAVKKGGFAEINALYLPIGCDLEKTLGLIDSVISTWQEGT